MNFSTKLFSLKSKLHKSIVKCTEPAWNMLALFLSQIWTSSWKMICQCATQNNLKFNKEKQSPYNWLCNRSYHRCAQAEHTNFVAYPFEPTSDVGHSFRIKFTIEFLDTDLWSNCQTNDVLFSDFILNTLFFCAQITATKIVLNRRNTVNCFMFEERMVPIFRKLLVNGQFWVNLAKKNSIKNYLNYFMANPYLSNGKNHRSNDLQRVKVSPNVVNTPKHFSRIGSRAFG
jgi:hypothetical protein